MRELKLVARYPEVLQLEIGLRGLINGGIPADQLGRENAVEDLMRRFEAVMHAELLYLQSRELTDLLFEWERRSLSTLCDLLMKDFSPVVDHFQIIYHTRPEVDSGIWVTVTFEYFDPEVENPTAKKFEFEAMSSDDVKQLLIAQLDKFGLRTVWLMQKSM